MLTFAFITALNPEAHPAEIRLDDDPADVARSDVEDDEAAP
jgi:hypothetical protein